MQQLIFLLKQNVLCFLFVCRRPDLEKFILIGYILMFLSALRDLFGHYMEAWNSWYSEVAGGKNPIQLQS